MELTGYSFWGSHILASAEASGAECLYSEDMQHGHKVAGPGYAIRLRRRGPADEKRHIDAAEGQGGWTGRGCCDFRPFRQNASGIRVFRPIDAIFPGNI